MVRVHCLPTVLCVCHQNSDCGSSVPVASHTTSKVTSQSVNFITANVLALLTSLQTQNDRPQRNNNTTFVLNFSKLQTSITNKMAKNLNYFFTVNLKILSSRTKHNIVFCPKYKDKNVMNILRLYFRCHSVVLSHYK